MHHLVGYHEVGEPDPEAILAALVPTFGPESESRQDFNGYADELFSEEPYPTMPSIGIEIELKHRVLDARIDWYLDGVRTYKDLEPDEKAEVDMVFQHIDDTWVPRLEAIRAAGLLVGKDSYAELILPPYRSNSSLRRVTNYLYASGLIPAEHEHPLHVTLGGIDLRGDTDQAHYLARMVELMDGATAQRISGPIMSKKPSWTFKSRTGFLLRTGVELAGNARHGIELRALGARSADQLAKVIWRTQWFGTFLNTWLQASEAERQEPFANATPFTFDRATLIDGWNSAVNFFKEVYRVNGVELDNSWSDVHDSPEQWMRHFVMCGTDLGNLAVKQELYQRVDGFIQDTEASVARYFDRYLAMSRSENT